MQLWATFIWAHEFLLGWTAEVQKRTSQATQQITLPLEDVRKACLKKDVRKAPQDEHHHGLFPVWSQGFMEAFPHWVFDEPMCVGVGWWGLIGAYDGYERIRSQIMAILNVWVHITWATYRFDVHAVGDLDGEEEDDSCETFSNSFWYTWICDLVYLELDELKNCM